MLKTQEKMMREVEAETREKSSYGQDLFTIDREHLRKTDVKRRNTRREFEYGYNADLDVVIISKDGTLGDIYKVQGLRIGIPLAPKEIDGMKDKPEDQVFKRTELPASIKKIHNRWDFKAQSEKVKEEYYDLIPREFERRSNGYWFMNGGEPNYITGSHYMFLNYTKIDAADGTGRAEFRQANRIFHYFWEACKADKRCFGMCYLKNRRSGFSFMASSETVNMATNTQDAMFGMLSKTGADAKSMFTRKVVPITRNYPFFFKPIQDGSDNPKNEIQYQVPATKLTKNSLKATQLDEDVEGLNTIINWKSTNDNSYDGEKLRLLVHDESGKWQKPENIINNWTVTKTCLMLGRKVIGKCMMGSTSNALSKGGEEFKEIYDGSNLLKTERNKNGQTPTGLYALFLNACWGAEGFIDKHGYPVFELEEGEEVMGVDGEPIDQGYIDYWKNIVEGLKSRPENLNEHYRQFPMTEEHAFRDEADNSLFNIVKIYDQIDYNNEFALRDGLIMKGNFEWKNGIQDTEVEWHPHNHGRFYITRVMPRELQNNWYVEGNLKKPGNHHIGAFGCDSYDISATTDGRGSKGALHGVTGFHMENFPTNQFFLEYIARPPMAEIFYEDVLKACVFYGMPILVENNKPRLLYHFLQRGYRGYSINRPDRVYSKLSATEKELGGIPNSSADVIQAHAAAIEAYVEKYVGQDEQNGGYHQMYFQRTLNDWIHFDISDRTRYDASISSGLALMAVNRLSYKPVRKKTYDKLQINMGSYSYSGGANRGTRMNPKYN